MNSREVKEGLIIQGADEAWRYSLDTSPVNGTATGTPTLTVYDENGYQNVTSTVVSGACTLVGTTITTGIIRYLLPDHTYKCIVQWSVSGGLVRSRYFRLRGEL